MKVVRLQVMRAGVIARTNPGFGDPEHAFRIAGGIMLILVVIPAILA